MKSKRRLDCWYICRLLFGIGVIALFLALALSGPIFSYLKTLERNASWKGQVRDDFSSIKKALFDSDYVYSTKLLRCAKMRAEFLNMRRSEYLKMLSTAKNSLPAGIDVGNLPHDLRQWDETQIKYGLCSRGRLRLEGLQRKNELSHLADEIVFIHSSVQKNMLFDYGNIIEKMYELKRLNNDDIEFLEMRSGCDILNASGYSLFYF